MNICFRVREDLATARSLTSFWERVVSMVVQSADVTTDVGQIVVSVTWLEPG
jgi:hypothetical protein